MTTTDAVFDVFCPGVLEVLSIGKGDLKLSVGDNDADREAARDLIDEMLRKGYMIFVETEDGPVRVMGFIAASMSYVIEATPTDETSVEEPSTGAISPQRPEPEKKRRGKTKEIPVEGTRATAVGRTAGG